MDTLKRYADAWADGIVAGLGRAFPSSLSHSASGPDDCDVTPQALHPAFWGCLDWHSSAHMQWSAVTLLTLDAEGAVALSPGRAAALARVLDERLTPDNLEVEAGYLARHPGYERPYGWAWAALLGAAASTSRRIGAGEWAYALEPLLDVIEANALAWLPRQAYPVRHGVHDNTAFGLLLLHEAAVTLGRVALVVAIEDRARAWFLADRDYPIAWEPSGSDFLSAGLCEAALLRRILPASDFAGWLGEFLPGLGAEGDPVLSVPRVLDRADGKLVHLFGLGLSRAWLLRELAPTLDAERRARVLAAASAMVDAVASEITGGDFMSTHWLVSFALRAELVG